MSKVDLTLYGAAQELHCHTTFCDGKNTPEEMVLAAVKKGLRRIGFSAHAPSPYSASYAIRAHRLPEYMETVRALKQRYADSIEILLGLEQDLYSDPMPDGLDYVIGSVHSIVVGGVEYSVDHTPEHLARCWREGFGGDAYAMCEAYYENVAKLADMKPDIVGHIDLVTKFIEKEPLFDVNHPRYLAAAFGAVDALIPTGAIFEINTGAMSRGWRTSPYPAPALLDYIKQKGGRVLLTGDSHAAETLCYAFEDWKHLLDQGEKHEV